MSLKLMFSLIKIQLLISAYEKIHLGYNNKNIIKASGKLLCKEKVQITNAVSVGRWSIIICSNRLSCLFHHVAFQ